MRITKERPEPDYIWRAEIGLRVASTLLAISTTLAVLNIILKLAK